MLIYWLLFVVLLVAVINGQNKNKIFRFVSLVLFFIGFTRTNTVGVDLQSYSMMFNSTSFNKGEWDDIASEPGFIFFMAMFKEYVSNDPMSFFRFVFLLYFFFIFSSINRLSIDRPLSLFVYYSLSYYFFSFNGIRQALCFSIILYGFTLLILSKKTIFKIVLYVIYSIIISLLFHKSQILLSLLPLVYYNQNSKFLSVKVLVSGLILSMVSAIYFSDFILKRLYFINSFISLSDRYTGYIDSLQIANHFSFISNNLHALFAIYVLYTSRKYNNFYVQIFCIGTIILVLLSPLNWLFIRLSETYTFFVIYSIPIIWHNLCRHYEKCIFRIVVVLYCMILFANRLANDNNLDVVPYVNALFE